MDNSDDFLNNYVDEYEETENIDLPSYEYSKEDIEKQQKREEAIDKEIATTIQQKTDLNKATNTIAPKYNPNKQNISNTKTSQSQSANIQPIHSQSQQSRSLHETKGRPSSKSGFKLLDNDIEIYIILLIFLLSLYIIFIKV